MTPDALSRALRGERGFASVELVEPADLTGSDLHELITGDTDPHRLRVVSRHDYEHDTGRRTIPGREADVAVLDDVGLVYRQAGALPPTPAVPGNVEELGSALGEDFVRPFADRVEHRLAIDIVRVRELATCYSFAVDGRLVIAVDAGGNWFRSPTWSGPTPRGGDRDPRTAPSSAFPAPRRFRDRRALGSASTRGAGRSR